MTPASSFRSGLSTDDPVVSATDPRHATPGPGNDVRPRAGAPIPEGFELRCSDVHPLRCDEALRAGSLGDFVARVREHGAQAHGFTPVWYDAERLAVIVRAVTQRSA